MVIKKASRDSCRDSIARSLAKSRTIIREFSDRNDPFTDLGDILANLLHWANAYGIDFEEALERGKMHFEAEQAGEY